MALKKHSRELMKTYNEIMVYNYIRISNLVSRADISRATKMSATNVGRIVDNLIEEGLIGEVGTVRGMVGRKPTMLQVIPEGILAIAVSVDYCRVETGLVDIVGNITHYRITTSKSEMTQDEIVSRIIVQIHELIASLSEDQMSSIVKIGVCVPGIVDVISGEATSPQLGWQNVPIKNLIDEFNLDIMVENNVKGSAMAEHMLGSAKNDDDFVVITIGTGIGSAIMLNGKIFRGKNNVAGEIGHMIIEPGGLLCDCGRHGCLQSTLCMSGLFRKTGMRFKEIVDRANLGDFECESILNDTAEKLSCWIANITNIYDLSLIVVYGEMIELYPPLIKMMQARYKKYMWYGINRNFTIRKSGIAYEKLPILSAASVVFNHTLASEVFIR